jgi:hypothetical protein
VKFQNFIIRNEKEELKKILELKIRMERCQFLSNATDDRKRFKLNTVSSIGQYLMETTFLMLKIDVSYTWFRYRSKIPISFQKDKFMLTEEAGKPT